MFQKQNQGRVGKKKDTGRKETEGAVAINKEIEQMEEQLLPKEDKDIGLKIYTSESRGWLKKNFTFEELIQGINNHSYKYTYTDNTYTDELVLNVIGNGNITLHTCWNIVGNDNFRKIRTGLERERLPLNDRDPRARKYSHNYQHT